MINYWKLANKPNDFIEISLKSKGASLLAGRDFCGSNYVGGDFT